MNNLYFKYTAILMVAGLILMGFACTEIPPVLNPGGGGNNGGGPVDEQLRQVLIEEFTGVRCVNCPAGSQAIEALLDQHGSQLVAVSLHAGQFAFPFTGQEDYGNDDSRSILSYLGSPLGYPTAVVNRKKFDGEESRFSGLSSWAGFIAEELLTPPMIRIDLNTSFNDASGEVDIEADLYVDETILSDDVRLSVFITENDIVGPQVTPQSSQDDDYVHKHVFRTAVTGFDGDPINETLSSGAVVSRNLSVQLEDHWVAENCHVIALVHYGGGQLDVIQAHEVNVIE